MRTSKDVYSRIIYDNKFDPEDFFIGLKEESNIVDTPFEEYDPEEIPMHSILYFKTNGQIVWSRRPQIDLIFGSLTKKRQKEIEKEQELLKQKRKRKEKRKQSKRIKHQN
ncbi:leukocyte receptor cluster member 9 [Anaeramoeba flamelloides]|uniref:Leukocyte receptor cluster member n=1 Tax=Anaeramoeba flamelloides TaxID=1746091 RepID=A0AAV8AAG8_9EUKA|nr:leukocyte receptor cluster member [Anaeramoeba flamelloides]KAJ3451137.1 leukocyte receptor cluster member [Anaeramoeba flamelloides]KAJ6255363.1 leukocyte receptor cluster member 9 [Anaeramoeba flamelloides]KAJ6255387.1 leukocyte receptor cluster member 9 [Anaeramoeba flamelloides]